jgi:hypothetical protein
MKLNIVVPWVLVLGLSAGLASVLVKNNAKDAELTSLRQQAGEMEQLEAELAEARQRGQVSEDQVLVSRKDKEELLRLRNEVGTLRDERLKLARDIQTAQGRADAAKAQADDALRQAQAMTAQAAQMRATNRTAAIDTRSACINQLRQIDGAKQQWALENQKTAEAIPTAQEIAPYIGLGGNTLPPCPAGGVYSINAVGVVPGCSIPGHALQ